MSRQRERDAAEEIASHLEERIAELEEAGIPREQAAHQTRREFGNAALVTEDSRAVWRCQPWDNFRQDVRFALRWTRAIIRRLFYRSPSVSALPARKLSHD